LKDTLIIFLIILIITLSCLPLFKNISNINLHYDWLQMLSYYRAARETVLEYHQLPLRTHYFGGGYPLIANPQDGSLNPFFIPILIFGEVVGLKLNVYLVHLIGALGMYYLVRFVLGYNYLGALFSTLVFCLGGNAHRLLIRGQGFFPTFYYFFIPLLLAFFIKAKGHKKFLFYTVFVLAIMLTQAGLYLAPILLFIFLFSCLEAVEYEDKRFKVNVHHIKNFAIIISLSFLLSAIKVFPMIELLIQNPRPVDNYAPFWDPLFPKVFTTFLIHQKNFSFAGEHWNYFYIGFIPIILAFAAFLFCWQKNKRLFVLLAIFGLLTFGAHTHLDLFRLLWQFPIFHSIDSPSRYFSPLIIFIISLVAGSIFCIQQKPKNKVLNFIFISLIIFVGLDLFFTNGSKEESSPFSVPEYQKQLSFYSAKNHKVMDVTDYPVSGNAFLMRMWEMARPTQYELMLQNIGKVNWYGNIHLGEYAVPKYYIDWNGVNTFDSTNYDWRINLDYKGEIYFLDNPKNKAEFQYFSPNKIVANVDVIEPDTLIINQNYDKYWKSDLFKPINHSGLLAVNLNKKGNYLVNLSYVPLSFYLGLVTSLSALGFIIYNLRKTTKAVA
jgi:hypothetical protein